MKKNAISGPIMTFRPALVGWFRRLGVRASVAGPVVANSQQAPPSDSQKADTSPQTGVPAQPSHPQQGKK